MYYKINYSVDEKVIGRCSQQFEDAEYPVHVEHPDFIGNFFLQKVDITKVIPAYPLLKKGAKRTDLLNGTWYGNSGKLLISDRLKKLLEKEGHEGLQFIKTHIFHKGLKYGDYWFTNPFGFDMNMILFDKSVVSLFGSGQIFIRNITIKNLTEFNKEIQKLTMPKRLGISKIVLRSSERRLILLRWVSGGLGYYVSESLKKEIENAGCTGIDFELVETA